MSKKRRKRPSRPEPRPKVATEAEVEEAPSRSGMPGFLGWLAPRTGDTPFPPIGRSIGRGLLVAGSALPVLAVSFGFAFLAWLALVALGLEGPAGRIVDIGALPPVGPYFDALNGVTMFGYGAPGLLVSLGFILVRAAYLAVLAGLIVVRLEGEWTPFEGVRRGLRAYPTVLAVNLICLSMMITGSVVLPFLGPGLGFLGSVLILIAALFFFAFAPAAAIREERPTVETIRRSGRAAMMPGSRHVLMCLLYIFLGLPVLVALSPSGSELTVNPTIAAWVYGLLATFVHSAFLAAFSYRWMAVEDEVPEQPVRRRR